jgi:Ca2+-binding EF-hand superfamily protein
MDPLLSTLANFTSQSHLKAQIDMLFQLIDADDGGTINYEELYAGMRDMTHL